jgi:riboflavin-specific deaminase-like protein
MIEGIVMGRSHVQLARRARPAEAELDEEEAWRFVLSLLGRSAPPAGSRVDLETHDGLTVWRAPCGATPEAERLLDLCVPLCVGAFAQNLVVAHLGQSLDGRVAVPPGWPRLITGLEDLRHTHRLRALCDAVVVGATTVAVDNPQLTTRLVPGRHPVRVVLDPQARLPKDRGLFTDGQVASLVIVGERARGAYEGVHVEVVALALKDDTLPIDGVLGALRERGLRRIFVEGGGITVSRFLDAGALDRLHVAVASRIVGVGAPAIQLQVAMHGATARASSYLLGGDVLFDCDLRAGSAGRALA